MPALDADSCDRADPENDGIRLEAVIVQVGTVATEELDVWIAR